jgi:hypothetical protein
MPFVMTATLERILGEIAGLSQSEQVELRSLLHSPGNEGHYHRRLLEAGLVTKIPSGTRLAGRPDPVRVTGKPLSESLLEERR